MRGECGRWSVALVLVALVAGCDRATTTTSAETGDDGAQRLGEIATLRQQHERQSAWLQLPEAQRQRIRDAATAFAALPAAEQTRFRGEFAQLDHSEQRGWLLGPDAGALWPQLSPLFSYVPEDERAPLLGILHEMNADELQALGRIAWRTPPEQRDALRKELIAASPANLPAWLASASQR
ncbi:hypothetical protein [Solilutibacter silvestris]|uniref:DUF3106 domain-containing protein n=1 Tax=Solilutibacter silvestris TaxID=1645665 RepID=A0A2K1Q0I0_9GAMM|nr:hypothetical protein [Lysobacter silvestris]PNS08534.1 hypothetical protein Lysil_0163 [Lysobacter silvestris]